MRLMSLAAQPNADWSRCAFLSCSVLPVRIACNCRCQFCFSHSSVSALRAEPQAWTASQLRAYYAYAAGAGARRLVITGGGEPLLRPALTLLAASVGRAYFEEIACFTNGARLTAALASELGEAGVSYLCYSRHHYDDARNRELMGNDAPTLEAFMDHAAALPVRATCVMARGFIDSRDQARRYLEVLGGAGVREFTFKHTYTAYAQSYFGDTAHNRWAAAHAIEDDPFADEGEVLARLPWGPTIKRLGEFQLCHYREPTPDWELRHRLARSINLLSDGSIYASLEDRRSLLCRLSDLSRPSRKPA